VKKEKKIRDSIVAMNKRGTRYDPNDADHQYVVKVIDFICGFQSPPAPAVDLYMQPSLAATMPGFQAQMKQEVMDCGKKGSGNLERPVMATFWVIDRMFPSPENNLLRVEEIEAVVVDVGKKCGCMLCINVYIDGDKVSGFTLDRVNSMKNIEEELLKESQRRFDEYQKQCANVVQCDETGECNVDWVTKAYSAEDIAEDEEGQIEELRLPQAAEEATPVPAAEEEAPVSAAEETKPVPAAEEKAPAAAAMEEVTPAPVEEEVVQIPFEDLPDEAVLNSQVDHELAEI